MKKTFFLCGILVLAAGVFSSCEDDDVVDNNNSNETKKTKHLVSSTCNTSDDIGEPVEYLYEYDADGRMTKMYRKGQNTSNILSFNKTDTLLSSSWTVINTLSTEFNADGSYANKTSVTKYISDDTMSTSILIKYEYDEDKHLVSIDSYDELTGEKTENLSYLFYWENGNLIKYIEPRGNSDYASIEVLYEYTNEEVSTPLENKTGLLFYGYARTLSCVDRHGVASKNLPVSVINVKNGIRQRIDWTLDSDGYPIKEEVSWMDENGKANEIIGTMNFTWK